MALALDIAVGIVLAVFFLNVLAGLPDYLLLVFSDVDEFLKKRRGEMK